MIIVTDSSFLSSLQSSPELFPKDTSALSCHVYVVMEQVMGARGSSIVVEFDCGSQQFAECAAAIIKVSFLECSIPLSSDVDVVVDMLFF